MHLCKKNPCKLFPGQLYMRANKTAFKRPRLSQVMTESGRGDEVNSCAKCEYISSQSRYISFLSVITTFGQTLFILNLADRL